MSYLLDSACSQIPAVDGRLNGKILFCATEVIPEVIRNAMTSVLVAVADQIEKEKKEFGFSINCLFTTTRAFSISLYPNEMAVCMRLAVYPIYNLLPYAETWKLYTLLAEELCHLIWNISDETLVNFKVLEVLRNKFPDLELIDLYSEATVLDCERYAEEHSDEVRAVTNVI